MTSPNVIAKRDAAAAWVATVNGSDIVHERWGYILASEDVVAHSTNWDGIRAGGQVFA